ncbi:MAG: competence/damage-inducible protein A [Candidatus Eremiobacteraeota bacterium]|nr:competence/damage-inducible protein A [Candidatus Eremiobacteraeota bacterium]
MASVEILTVGTELLLGQLVDSNAPYIAQSLAQNGIDVFALGSVGDNRLRIRGAIDTALARADGLIVTGGLGPTVDDLTKEAVAEALGRRLAMHEESLRAMVRIFAANGRTMHENNRQQALLPEESFILRNAHGTAPGFIALRSDGKFVACMPGVPHEMRAMFGTQLLPWLRERLKVTGGIHTQVLRTFGLSESEVDHRIADLFRSSENPKIAVLAHDGIVDVKIMTKAQTQAQSDVLLSPLEAELRHRLKDGIFGSGQTSLALAVHTALQGNSQTVSVGESCTGGSVCAALSSVAGASKTLRGGVVAYDNSVKIAALRVAPATIEQYGAVSEQVAVQMAEGARKTLGSSVGLATTGIAGPEGGSSEMPVGLVWFAIDGPDAPSVRKFHFQGDRVSIQRRATTVALGLLWKALQPQSEPERLSRR